MSSALSRSKFNVTQMHQEVAGLLSMRNLQRHRRSIHTGAALRRVAVAMRDLPMNARAAYFCAGAATMLLLCLAVVCIYAFVYVSGTIAQAERDEERL